MSRFTRPLLIITGTICAALGMIGVFLPLVPTTPFLLLAAACYARSSERFYNWMLTNGWFGEYVRNYREGKGVMLHHKVLTLAALWVTVGYTALLVVSQWWVKLILLAIAVGVTIHLIMIKTYRREQKNQLGALSANKSPEPAETGDVSTSQS